MGSRLRAVAVVTIALWYTGIAMEARAAVDTNVIRLGAPSPERATTLPQASGIEGRRAFDYETFGARLEGLWFQRKAFLAEGRTEDAARYSELIRSFCVEEGVHRLSYLSGALVLEARRFLREGSYDRAFDSLALAEFLDPGRSQVRFAKSAVLWKSGTGIPAAGIEAIKGVVAVAVETWTSLSLLSHLALTFLVATLGCVTLFSILMVGRYQMVFRHAVEEWAIHRGAPRWAVALGWTALLLPLAVWIGAGWIVLYWIGITYVFMRRRERMAAIVLLGLSVALVPIYRACVGLYGLGTDPTATTVTAAASGQYEPEKIVQLQKMVDSHPDDPTFRFLLAGLYKNGRYFEEAYEQYRRVVSLSPGHYQALINMGNIFFHTGQYAEALAQYRRALEARPDSLLAHYNMYLAQSETFRFQEAEESLRRAKELDTSGVATLFARRGENERSVVVDASLDSESIWKASLGGRELRGWLEDPGTMGLAAVVRPVVSPVSVVSLFALICCVGISLANRRGPSARRCIRCGRPYCHLCRGSEPGSEYCSQCLHLFVLKDGLAAETKTRKLYQVDRYERRRRWTRSFSSFVLPGASQVLGGATIGGCVLIVAWLGSLLLWSPGLLVPVERLLGSDFNLHLLRPTAVPTPFQMNPFALVAVPLAALAWIAGNAWRRRERGV